MILMKKKHNIINVVTLFFTLSILDDFQFKTHLLGIWVPNKATILFGHILKPRCLSTMHDIVLSKTLVSILSELAAEVEAFTVLECEKTIAKV